MKRVFIVHGWGGNPEEGWFPWLKKELEAKGFQIFVPQLPYAENPQIENWVPKLAETVGVADEATYFVGHSMGCQTITRYLESLPKGLKVGGAVFVGGFFKHLSGHEDDVETQAIRKQWLETPLDLAEVRLHLPKSVAIFSDDDPWVPLDNQDDFRNKLGSKIVIEHNKGHFNDEGLGVKELPIALEALLSMQ